MNTRLPLARMSDVTTPPPHLYKHNNEVSEIVRSLVELWPGGNPEGDLSAGRTHPSYSLALRDIAERLGVLDELRAALPAHQGVTLA
ncbi:hypothetical protein FHW79_005410 [Azospirillum sp. OGB3]|uniref:hypothetical protein n=1 Tax=Azospirillum sp. OGB3 TaxID=2587012 RepID=UPI001605A60D|nr:hypothetical protein [Azospirillum sp. OGB3]MBB3267745.1 hypothetical protein [Azospirillum sp. OGB3]